APRSGGGGTGATRAPAPGPPAGGARLPRERTQGYRCSPPLPSPVAGTPPRAVVIAHPVEDPGDRGFDLTEDSAGVHSRGAPALENDASVDDDGMDALRTGAVDKLRHRVGQRIRLRHVIRADDDVGA